jgi:hypothetical protein
MCELLGRGKLSKKSSFLSNTWLNEKFGAQGVGEAELTRQLDLPEGPDGYWLRADPVHLRPDRDRVMLFDASSIGLRDDEAQTLIASLNEQFGEDGLRFYKGTASRWYVRLDATQDIVTTPLALVCGQDMHPYLPHGADGLKWHRIMNEIQMLMYTHPINDQRELAGQSTANSVWLWGEGAKPQRLRRPFDVVIADSATSQALGVLSGATVTSLADGLGAGVASGNTLLWLDTLSAPMQYGDIHAWRDGLQAIDRDWFAPLLSQWRSGTWESIDFILPGADSAHCVRLEKTDRWKFWRRPMPIAKLVN